MRKIRFPNASRAFGYPATFLPREDTLVGLGKNVFGSFLELPSVSLLFVFRPRLRRSHDRSLSDTDWRAAFRQVSVLLMAGSYRVVDRCLQVSQSGRCWLAARSRSDCLAPLTPKDMEQFFVFSFSTNSFISFPNVETESIVSNVLIVALFIVRASRNYNNWMTNK